MHEKNFYQYDMPDAKVLDLSQQLRKGTELGRDGNGNGNGIDSQEYNEFAERIRTRVKELARQLERKGLIANDQKTRQFTEEWDAREQIWKEDLVSSKVVSAPSHDIFEVPVDDNELFTSTPSKPQRSTKLFGLSMKRKV